MKAFCGLFFAKMYKLFQIHWGKPQRTMLQQTVFNNKIRMLQRTQMLQLTRRNTIGRRSTLVRLTCSIIIFTRERLFMLFMCVRLFMIFIRGSLFIVFTEENCLCFSNLHVQCIKVK
jgi:hypothetical protein